MPPAPRDTLGETPLDGLLKGCGAPEAATRRSPPLVLHVFSSFPPEGFAAEGLGLGAGGGEAMMVSLMSIRGSDRHVDRQEYIYCTICADLGWQ
jgi:hypothetical protein